ncbi:MAG: hypothetical protein DWP97_06330 [Calditrichaeota bacterium]|nr:MAG: hypothetical protein DWP97_06330 [Calditrichota bacterium]
MRTDSQNRIDDLIKEAQAGDRRAYSELVKIHMNKIQALTYKMTGDSDTATDLTQETFVAAWTNLKTFKFEAKFESWLYRIAYNKTLNSLKREKNMVSDYDFDQHISTSNPETDLYQKELKTKVLSFMQGLPTEQRGVFELRFYKEYSFAEIADTTGKALGTVKTLYREAVKKLYDTAEKQRWRT